MGANLTSLKPCHVSLLAYFFDKNYPSVQGTCHDILTSTGRACTIPSKPKLKAVLMSGLFIRDAYSDNQLIIFYEIETHNFKVRGTSIAI